MQFTPGRSLGPYEIVSVLGEGGMGTVYRAHDGRLGRDVAVKVLRAELLGDEEHQKRFLQEARAASALNHPAIVTVHDLGTQDGAVYIVMELVDGRPLDQVLPRGGFPVAQLLKIGMQMADACAVAHAHQIIHRDLKPANVMLQPDGRVRILDFGLAKMIEEPVASDGRTVTRTGVGTIVGTIAYMSPEQAEGKPLDARTDIFSLGAVLYELASGLRAFRGDSQASVLAEVIKQDPRPLDEVRLDLPPDLVRMITRCLRKDPGRRVQTMADLRATLEELKEDVDSGKLTARTVAPASASSRRRWLYAIAILGVVVAAGAIGVSRWRPAAVAPAEAPLVSPLTTYAGSEREATFSPDGNQVAFSWDGESQQNRDIYVKLIGPGPPLRLTTNPAIDDEPRWSPDGRLIAFIRFWPDRHMSLMTIPPLGGAERKLVDLYPRWSIGAIMDIAWSADSRSIYVAAGRSPGEPSHINRVALDSGDVKTLVTVTNPADGYSSLDVAPDGTRLVAVLAKEGARLMQMFAIDAAGDLEPRPMPAITVNSDTARWTADSRDLLFAPSVNNPLPLYRVDLASGVVRALPWSGAGASLPAVARVGDRMVFTRAVRDTNIWRVDLRSPKLSLDRIAVSSFREVAPAYSPDATRIAFHSNRGGSVQIWTAAADGTNPVQLTSMNEMATTGSPQWSPDSQSVVFDSNGDGGYHVYTIRADGGQPHPVTSGTSRNFIASWSPDGRWIYFTSDRSGRLEIWRAAPDGSHPTQVTTVGAQASRLSPDGTWLYFTKEDGAAGLFRIPIGGGQPTQLVPRIIRYNYVPVPTGVYFESGTTQAAVLQFLDFATGKVRDILRLDHPADLGLAVSSDERYLLFTQIDYASADLMLVEHFR
jgi:eukaryotic-like serine/threonine-protein kinase